MQVQSLYQYLIEKVGPGVIWSVQLPEYLRDIGVIGGWITLSIFESFPSIRV